MQAGKAYRFNIVNCEKLNSQFNFGMLAHIVHQFNLLCMSECHSGYGTCLSWQGWWFRSAQRCPMHVAHTGNSTSCSSGTHRQQSTSCLTGTHTDSIALHAPLIHTHIDNIALHASVAHMWTTLPFMPQWYTYRQHGLSCLNGIHIGNIALHTSVAHIVSIAHHVSEAHK